jgi:hypothetical protein
MFNYLPIDVLIKDMARCAFYLIDPVGATLAVAHEIRAAARAAPTAFAINHGIIAQHEQLRYVYKSFAFITSAK